MYYYNSKLFGLCRGEHRQICLKTFETGDNYVNFEESASKALHGRLLDLKHEPRIVRYICRSVGEKYHEHFLTEYYHLCNYWSGANMRERS